MAVWIVFLPLIAAIVAGFFGRTIGDRGAQYVTCGAVCASAVLSLFVFAGSIPGRLRSIGRCGSTR
jgi:NADH-quinone oxidoreductase subunit L